MTTPTVISESQDTVSGSTGSTPTTTGAVPAGALVVLIARFDSNVGGGHGVGWGLSAPTLNGNAFSAVNNAGPTSTGSEMWFLVAPAGGIASGATLSYTYVGGNMSVFIAKVAYVTGTATSPLDVSGAGTGTGVTSITVSTGALSQANEIIFAMAGKITGTGALTEDGAFTTLGTFTDGLTADKDGLNFAFQNVTSNASVSYVPSYSVNTNFANIVAGFKIGAADFIPYTPYRQLGPILAQRTMLGWRKAVDGLLWKPKRPRLWTPPQGVFA